MSCTKDKVALVFPVSCAERPKDLEWSLYRLDPTEKLSCTKDKDLALACCACAESPKDLVWSLYRLDPREMVH